MDRRETRFAQLFSSEPNDAVSTNVRTILNELEKLRLSENKIWWDKNMLQRYREENIIPRGLRMKKQPTTLYDADFQDRWNNILSQCSLALMELIVEKEITVLEQMKIEINDKEKILQSQITESEREDIFKSLNDKIKKQEDSFVSVKQRKFMRDQQDYKSGSIYTWHKHRPRSILKKDTYRPSEKKRKVSFSRSGTDSESSFHTSGDSDRSMDSMEESRSPMEHQPMIVRPKTPRDGGARNTSREDRYLQRTHRRQ